MYQPKNIVIKKLLFFSALMIGLSWRASEADSNQEDVSSVGAEEVSVEADVQENYLKKPQPMSPNMKSTAPPCAPLDLDDMSAEE